LQVERRFGRIQLLLRQIDQRARDDGIAAVALKGSALHKIGMYSPGERPMADIDLLTGERDVARMVLMLETLELRETHNLQRHRILEPRDHRTAAALGESGDNDIKIELHTRLSECLPVRSFDVTATVFPRDAHPGLNDYPSLASLMSHLLMHAAGNMAGQGLRLLHLHDIALLCTRMTEMDWEELFRPDGNTKWWAFPPLALTARYYITVPDNALRSAARICPGSLRRACRHQTLSDVSLSHLWVDALPGIAWAVSTRERAEYLRRRVFPNRENIKIREVSLRSTGARTKNDWRAVSQSRRLLRWVTSRPAKGATLSAIHAAFASST
jgi:hypothetical protein